MRQRLRKKVATRAWADKLKELILYVAQQAEGATLEQVSWILFTVDFKAYRDHGRSITGSLWRKGRYPEPEFHWKTWRKHERLRRAA